MSRERKSATPMPGPVVSFRNLPRSETVEAVVYREAQKLARHARRIVSCRVAIERPQRFQRGGNAHRVRLLITMGSRRPIVVSREPLDSDMHDDLRSIVISAFKAACRQVQAVAEQRRGEVKAPHEPRALVARLFAEAGYGFLKTTDDRDVYFHRHSVLHDGFERLAIGTEVRFNEADGEKGPQASTVQIVNKPGIRTSGSGRARPRSGRGTRSTSGKSGQPRP